jgi:hypothetical protein
MSKYTPLAEFLKAQGSVIFSCSFSEIEDALGFKLPPSAYQHRAWWSNNPDNNVMTKAWLAAGFETMNVNIEEHTVFFRKILPPPPPIEAASRAAGMSDVARPFSAPHAAHHPVLGALKGTIRVAVEFDLTAPADPDWGTE